MTLEEANEKFVDAEMRFSSYYKYVFSFRGEKDGYRIGTSFGGDHDSIYRFSVDMEARPLGRIEETWHSVTIRKGDEIVFEYHDW